MVRYPLETASRLLCVITTPFGTPVDPDVYMMIAVEFGVGTSPVNSCNRSIDRSVN